MGEIRLHALSRVGFYNYIKLILVLLYQVPERGIVAITPIFLGSSGITLSNISFLHENGVYSVTVQLLNIKCALLPISA